MLIECENVTIKMNNENGELKTRSEVEFPIKSSRTSPLNSSREEFKCSIPFLLE